VQRPEERNSGNRASESSWLGPVPITAYPCNPTRPAKMTQQSIPTAATFRSAKFLFSSVGACPGDDESAGANHSRRSPNGNRHMRQVLNQTANAAAGTKGSIFDIVYRNSVPGLRDNQAIGAVAHRQCRLIWLILHQGVRREERGPAVTKRSKQRRTAGMIWQLRTLGYRIGALVDGSTCE
jgi:hypothetical protein